MVHKGEDIMAEKSRKDIIVELEKQVIELENQVEDLEVIEEADNRLLTEYYRVMDVIPECPAHGNRCVPHAVEWIRRVIALGKIITKTEEKI